MTISEELPVIKVVGISASGKSTLVKQLRQAGYNARPVSQEHSHIANLWAQFDQPAVLIYLDTDLATQQKRRPDVTWNAEVLITEQKRLAHARDHADLRINTASTDALVVFQVALVFLKHRRIRHAKHPLPPVAATGSAQAPVLESMPQVELEPKQKRRKRKKQAQ